MAKATEARLDHYLANQNTQDYIKELKEAIPEKSGNEILHTIRGGKIQGTWASKEADAQNCAALFKRK